MHAFEVVIPALDADLEVRDGVAVSRDAEDALGLRAAECEDAVCKEREDDGYLEVRIGAFLQAEDRVEGLAEGGGVEGRVLRCSSAEGVWKKNGLTHRGSLNLSSCRRLPSRPFLRDDR